jgi:hypothetical protein
VTAALVLWRSLPVLILAALWETAARTGMVSEHALPALSSVFAAFGGAAAGELYYHTARSVGRGLTAMAGAIPFGVAAGILIAWYLPVRVLLNPILQCLYPMPKVALIPLTIIWLGHRRRVQDHADLRRRSGADRDERVQRRARRRPHSALDRAQSRCFRGEAAVGGRPCRLRCRKSSTAFAPRSRSASF